MISFKDVSQNVLIILALALASCSKEKTGGKTLTYIFHDDISGAIARAAIEPNGGATVAIHTGDTPTDLAIDAAGNNIYLAEGFDGSISVYNPNNLANSRILYSYNQTLNGTVDALAIDETKNRIYWVDNLHAKLNRGSLDGKETPTTLFTIPNNGSLKCTGVVLNPATNIIYFTDANANKIFSADLNAGGSPTELVSTSNYTINQPRDLAISADGKSLYWPDPDNHINVTDISTKTTSVLFSSGMISLFVNSSTNDIYLSAWNKIFKRSVGSSTMSTVLEDKELVYPNGIISFVVH